MEEEKAQEGEEEVEQEGEEEVEQEGECSVLAAEAELRPGG